jgi:hypothetical protein
MKEDVIQMLEAARENLESYKAMGDADAIRAGQLMVEQFEKILAGME